MRAVLDTNVYISFLLNPAPDRIPARLVVDGLSGRFQLCVCGEQLAELGRTVSAKAALLRRIPAPEIDALMTRLRTGSHFIDELPLAMPGVVRDANDDYLVAHAMAASAGFIISGDKDLLALERVGDVRIVSPAEFVFLLEMEDR